MAINYCVSVTSASYLYIEFVQILLSRMWALAIWSQVRFVPSQKDAEPIPINFDDIYFGMGKNVNKFFFSYLSHWLV